jgi:hypothetical protein
MNKWLTAQPKPTDHAFACEEPTSSLAGWFGNKRMSRCMFRDAAVDENHDVAREASRRSEIMRREQDFEA